MTTKAAVDNIRTLVKEVEQADNWKHRSSNMKCRTCMWFSLKKNQIGRCRRRAPTMGGFPVVYETDWCGDHKLNEE